MNYFFFNNEFLTELVDMKINLDIFFFQTTGTVENPNPLTIQATQAAQGYPLHIPGISPSISGF